LGLRSRRLPGRLKTFFAEELQRPDLLARFPDSPWSRPYVRSFLAVMAELTQAQGKTHFLDKTPDHIYHLACIERWLPQAPVLHLLRDGADVVASLYQVTQELPKLFGGKPRSVKTCIDNWRQAIAQSRQRLGKPNHAFVYYSKLTTDPEGVLRNICQFLNLSYEPEMLTNYPTVSQQVQLTSEVHKRNTGEAIVSKTGHKFYEIFTPEQQSYILAEILQDSLDLFPFL
jgi:Sulfotransferase family